jgi:hypothetical protein
MGYQQSQQSHPQAGKTEPKVFKSAPENNNEQSTIAKSEGWSRVHYLLYQQQDRMNK